jgi:large subunit ribosomal protein L5
MANFQELYNKTIRKNLMKDLMLDSIMAVPKVSKITLNMGVGEALTDKKVLEKAVSDMELIVGQKPVITYARKSVAGFKVREGWPIGCKVTIRREKMYEFLERLVVVAIPRIRDFRGLSVKGFDGYGNFNMGIKEQIVFPEIDYDKIDAIRGMDIAITTTAKDNKSAIALLAAFDFPFKDHKDN